MLSDQATKQTSRPVGRGPEGAAQGAASDAAPQPPAPNTNLVLSVPELRPPPVERLRKGKGGEVRARRAKRKRGRRLGKKEGH